MSTGEHDVVHETSSCILVVQKSTFELNLIKFSSQVEWLRQYMRYCLHYEFAMIGTIPLYQFLSCYLVHTSGPYTEFIQAVHTGWRCPACSRL